MSFLDYTITLTETWQIVIFVILYVAALAIVGYVAIWVADKHADNYPMFYEKEGE